MKNVIKTTIGIIAISFASISVSQADSNRDRDHARADRTSQKQHAKQFDRYKKHYQIHRQQRGNFFNKPAKRPHWKQAHSKRHYMKHDHKRAIKQMRRDRAYRHTVRQVYRNRAQRRDYGYGRYVAPAHRVTYTRHSHSNKVVPILAGGLIGSSIANRVSHGDPGATVGGAIFGAIIGDAIARH